MATVLELMLSGALYRLDPGLGPRELEVRRIFLLPRARDWMEKELPDTASNWNIEEDPAQQLDALVYEFCVGEPLAIGQRFKAVRPVGDGVWELKTADLRIFGWFAQKDCFIVCDCDTTLRVKQMSLYRGYRDQAVRFRERLDLDEPKFVAGDDPNDVVSDSYQP
ncbi:hypothetical protein [Sphingopyxis sp. C-1]|jgi:hypothetical protein|uniref:hypothetical protein n=1 Tax=Sphingopyxis sp. C-1 TaxID=262667 RepID=UPI0007834A6B|nr:hypothetical protein [Sphingopyxis sp. C-1]